MTEIVSYRKNKLVEQFTQKIATAWHKATQSILETGKHLLEAEEKLSFHEFRNLRRELDDRRIISQTVISKIMSVARNQVLSNPKYRHSLPPSYATLYLLSQQDDTILTEKIISHEVTPEIEQKDVKTIFETVVGETKENDENITSEIDLKGDFSITLKGDFSKILKKDSLALISILKRLKTQETEVHGIELS